ncbi:hypothetical protein G6735_06645 [Polynucleobacter paneuropaeus]|nr:hypothetical protein [Polynucleobacter paneuropaeus]
MKKVLIFLAIFYSFFISNGYAAFKTGNEIYPGLEDWKRTPSINQTTAAIAFGYVVGVSDALDQAIFCLPPSVTAGQITDIVYAYMRDNPQIRQKDASYLVATALKPYFQCRK